VVELATKTIGELLALEDDGEEVTTAARRGR
jgi:hypothetical protein